MYFLPDPDNKDHGIYRILFGEVEFEVPYSDKLVRLMDVSGAVLEAGQVDLLCWPNPATAELVKLALEPDALQAFSKVNDVCKRLRADKVTINADGTHFVEVPPNSPLIDLVLALPGVQVASYWKRICLPENTEARDALVKYVFLGNNGLNLPTAVRPYDEPIPGLDEDLVLALISKVSELKLPPRVAKTLRDFEFVFQLVTSTRADLMEALHINSGQLPTINEALIRANGMHIGMDFTPDQLAAIRARAIPPPF